MDKASQLMIGAGITAIYHPLAFAKVLVQIGYEPLPPKLSTTWFGSQYYMYPNIFKYVGYIYRTDGFLGLYRGLGPRLVSGLVCSYVTNSMQEEINGKPLTIESTSDTSVCEDNNCISQLIKDTTCESISRCAGILASQPFYVIFIRSMAQFIGRETKYLSITSSISHIWHSEGIVGFFSGLIPRLVGEVITIWIANTITYAINGFIISLNGPSQVQSSNAHTGIFSQLIASQITYSYSLVSVVMAVNNCGLAAGSQPIMPVYNSWLECWSSLALENQLKRGSGMFWRKYYGPINAISPTGIVMPPIEKQKNI